MLCRIKLLIYIVGSVHFKDKMFKKTNEAIAYNTNPIQYNNKSVA